MTRIAFTADLHIDSYGQRVDPATGLNARLVDYLATLRFVGEEAVRQECDALVVAGDFTERRHPAPWLVNLIRDALSHGPDRQVYLRGNHDGEIAGGSIVSILDDGLDEHDEIGRSGISRPRLEPISFDCVLACIPYLDRHWLRAQPGFEHVPDDEVNRILADQLLTIARGLYAEARRDYPDAGCVLVLHQTLAGAHMSETQQAFLGDRGVIIDSGLLTSIGFEAIVAGHLHRHQEIGIALYPGSIERVDFGEEHEAKGFVIADIGPGQFDWHFVETPARRFVTIDAGEHPFGPSGVDFAGLVDDAVVRVLNAAPGDDWRQAMEAGGAFEIAEIRKRPVVAPELAGGLSEAMSPDDALEEYFKGDPDTVALIEEGRRLLAEVSS